MIRPLHLGPLAVLLAALVLMPAAVPAQTKKDSKEKSKKGSPKSIAGIPGYKKHTIVGFTLLINDEVYKNNDDPRWKRKPLDVLELELETIVQSLPDKPVAALRKLLIWIEWEDNDDPDIGKAVAKYYGGSSAWVLSRGKHPLKANGIEVINMKSLTRSHQPGTKFEFCVLLHEMAHAVHHQVIGFKNPQIATAYKQAMARGLYEKSKDVHGRTITKPYASTNDREYFAELTCAYLNKLYYHPFNPEDLKSHDPAGYRMMEQVWGTRKRLDAALKARAENHATKRIERATQLWIAGKKTAAIEAAEFVVEKYAETKAAARATKLLQKWKPGGS